MENKEVLYKMVYLYKAGLNSICVFLSESYIFPIQLVVSVPRKIPV